MALCIALLTPILLPLAGASDSAMFSGVNYDEARAIREILAKRRWISMNGCELD
jgi:hypothetical protein